MHVAAQDKGTSAHIPLMQMDFLEKNTWVEQDLAEESNVEPAGEERLMKSICAGRNYIW